MRVPGYPGQDDSYPQLQMLWPEQHLAAPPPVRLPPGYGLRTYRRGDEPRFYEIMALAGWPGWDDKKLQPWLPRLLPDGWFMAVHLESGETVATAMALSSDAYPSGGELGWLAADPAHTGKGLGMAVTAAVTTRFIDGHCHPIHLYTEHWRLPALKTYLKVGYVPFLCTREMAGPWRAVCAQLDWPFAPELWATEV
jgi:mycothiol synthase